VAARSARSWFADLRHPRLVAAMGIGAAVVLLGAALSALGAGGSLGSRLALLGALVLAYGASGYVAFWVFDRAS